MTSLFSFCAFVGLATAVPAFAEDFPGLELSQAQAQASKIITGDDEDAAVGGLPRFHTVAPGLYRSGKPSPAGLASLKGLGIKTILSLTGGADKERERAAGLGIAVESVRMSGLFRPPSFAQMDAALAILMDPAKRPLLVHCTFGKDRAGFVVAAYRVVAEGMAIDQATREAKSYGCCLSSFGDLKTYLQDYLKHRGAAAATPS